MTLRNPHEQTEAFQPLGAPIRPEPAKPAASPAVASPGIIRHADGTLGTAIPPPSAPAPVVRAMRERDSAVNRMPQEGDYDLARYCVFIRGNWEPMRVLGGASTVQFPPLTDDQRAKLEEDFTAKTGMIASHEFAEISETTINLTDPTNQAWEGTEPPIPASAWPAYSKDYSAGYRDGYAAAMKQNGSLPLAKTQAETQAADWLTITKQVQDMPSK